MPRPTRHKLLVEVTDMSGMMSTKRVAGIVREVLRQEVDGYVGIPNVLMNINAKDPRRVAAAGKKVP